MEINETKLSGQAVRLQFKGHSLHAPSSDCPLNAYFMMYLVPEGAPKLLLHKSETIAEKNPVWRTFLVPISHFSFASASCSIGIDVYNYNINREYVSAAKLNNSKTNVKGIVKQTN